MFPPHCFFVMVFSKTVFVEIIFLILSQSRITITSKAKSCGESIVAFLTKHCELLQCFSTRVFFLFFCVFFFVMIFSKIIFVDFIFLILNWLRIQLYNFIFFKTLWIATVFPHMVLFFLFLFFFMIFCKIILVDFIFLILSLLLQLQYVGKALYISSQITMNCYSIFPTRFLFLFF